MKTSILGFCIALLVGASVAHAQDFKPFKVGLGLGLAIPGAGEGAGGGGLLYLEPGYRVTDMVLVGLRLESAIIARGIKGISNNDFSGEAASNVSYTLNGQYYFNDHYVRPFIGFGFGLFSLAAVKFNTGTTNPDADDVGAETRFGFYPRAGLDIGHFNLSLDYNIVPPTDVPGGGEVKNNYLAIRAGVSIGGGVGKKTNP
jgi:opacity protein-like surface antigen